MLLHRSPTMNSTSRPSVGASHVQPRVGTLRTRRPLHVRAATAVAEPPPVTRFRTVEPTTAPVMPAAYVVAAPTVSRSIPEDFIRHPLDPPTYVTATGRIVSIGDLHGDLDKTLAALRAASVLELDFQGCPVWVGGDTVIVQLGDVLDRGGDEIRIVLLLRELDRQAREQGGAVYMLNGNHESLNVCGDFRYVVGSGFLETAEYAEQFWPRQPTMSLDQFAYLASLRRKMFQPGGPMAQELAKNPTVLVVNDTVFAHGGLLPEHVSYGIERLNSEVAAWMRADPTSKGGLAPPPFLAMGDAKSVMWTRVYSREEMPLLERPLTTRRLRQALNGVGARRLVVGHTPQISGCNSECKGLVWRIDVGMSSGVLDCAVQVLEVRQEPCGSTAVEVLGADGLVLRSHVDPPVIPVIPEALRMRLMSQQLV